MKTKTGNTALRLVVGDIADQDTEAVDAAVMERQPLWNKLKHEYGPFDLTGDLHG